MEAVWVWDFGLAAQKATYGRFAEDTSYTKDYLQASGVNATLLSLVFPMPASGQFNLTYRWPGGSAGGFLKAPNDRYHVSWSTALGAPAPFRLTPSPSAAGPGTIPGDPSALSAMAADGALARYRAQGLSSYLVAVKLEGEPDVLHIRAYVEQPPSSLKFADAGLLPTPVRALITGIRPNRACQSARFGVGSGSAPRLHFDPAKNHDAWSITAPTVVSSPSGSVSLLPGITSSSAVTEDSVAEVAPFDQADVDRFSQQMESGDFAVPDAYSNVKTRGSAQRAFAKEVKDNYGNACAITGIKTKAFLVASHIVAWADDEMIRTDPSNGICLSTLVDRAFDAGFLTIGADRVVHIQTAKLTGDAALAAALLPYDGQALRLPSKAQPKGEYLDRRMSKS